MARNKLSFVLLSFRLSLAAFAVAFNPLSAAVAENPHNPASGLPAPPKSAVHEVREMLYGTEIVDPYRWLEDHNSPETRAWIDAENAYTDTLIGKLPTRDTLCRQVRAFIKI